MSLEETNDLDIFMLADTLRLEHIRRLSAREKASTAVERIIQDTQIPDRNQAIGMILSKFT